MTYVALSTCIMLTANCAVVLLHTCTSQEERKEGRKERDTGKSPLPSMKKNSSIYTGGETPNYIKLVYMQR